MISRPALAKYARSWRSNQPLVGVGASMPAGGGARIVGVLDAPEANEDEDAEAEEEASEADAEGPTMKAVSDGEGAGNIAMSSCPVGGAGSPDARGCGAAAVGGSVCGGCECEIVCYATSGTRWTADVPCNAGGDHCLCCGAPAPAGGSAGCGGGGATAMLGRACGCGERMMGAGMRVVCGVVNVCAGGCGGMGCANGGSGSGAAAAFAGVSVRGAACCVEARGRGMHGPAAGVAEPVEGERECADVVDGAAGAGAGAWAWTGRRR